MIALLINSVLYSSIPCSHHLDMHNLHVHGSMQSWAPKFIEGNPPTFKIQFVKPAYRITATHWNNSSLTMFPHDVHGGKSLRVLLTQTAVNKGNGKEWASANIKLAQDTAKAEGAVCTHPSSPAVHVRSQGRRPQRNITRQWKEDWTVRQQKQHQMQEGHQRQVLLSAVGILRY